MQDLASDLSPTNGWGPQLADNLQSHRSRADQLLRDHAERARQAELALDQHLQKLAQQCAHRDRKLQETERLVVEREGLVRQREEQLAAELKSLEQSQSQLTALENRLHQHQEEAADRQRQMLDQLKSEHEQLEQRRQVLQDQHDQQQLAIEQQRIGLESQRAELQQQRGELQERRAELEQQRAELEQQRAELQEQRVALAAERSELERERAAAERDKTELELSRREIQHQADSLEAEQFQLERDRAELETRLLAYEGSDAGEASVGQPRSDLAEQHFQAHQAASRELTERLELQYELLQQLRQELADTRASRDEDANWERQLQELRGERDTMAQRLREIQERTAEPRNVPAANGVEVDDTELKELREDLERAEREIATLRSRNADLLRQLEPGRHAPSAGELDWEAQKQRLLARLESEATNDDPAHAEDRLTIEGAIRITDEVIAERDRLLAQRDAEIVDLKRQLERLSQHQADAEHDLPSSADSPDQDESVNDERQKLKRLQQAFQDKLRQAEIEISVERAKLARERSDLESKVQMLVSRFGELEPSATEASAKKSNRGRWLSRLGLASQDPSAS
jgi:chromosome segregation ATPase